jgi:hypothetical protein
MGCICIEFVIWLLYGYSELERLNGSIVLKFYVVEEESDYGGSLVAKVHPTITKWVDHILKMHSRCSDGTALRELIEMVTTGLLVVETDETLPSSRFTAQIFFDIIDNICKRVDNGDLIRGTHNYQYS